MPDPVAVPDPETVVTEFVEFCAERGFDVTQLTEQNKRSLLKSFREARHLKAVNKATFGESLPKE